MHTTLHRKCPTSVYKLVCGLPVPSRTLATVSKVFPANFAGRHHKVVVVGCGSAGVTVSHQLLRSGKFSQDEIAIIDPAQWHHYQPGWTLVGAGLKKKEDLRRPMRDLIGPKFKFYSQSVDAFSPEDNTVHLGLGDRITYDQLVVAPGIALNTSAIKGLPEALANPDSNVASIYSYDSCDQAFRNIDNFRGGKALFTQPAGVVKCAGAPQKIMWLALDKWKQAGLYKPGDLSSSTTTIAFATGLGVMFGVPKYSKALDKLRLERGVEGLFQHDLVRIDGNTAIFSNGKAKETVQRRFDMLHVVPKMVPHAFIKSSPIANEDGFVDVSDSTTQHKKYQNVWACGDASSLPTSKTAAAITGQAPTLVRNLLRNMEGKPVQAEYDGYTSCPLLTEYGKVMLAEFKYGAQPKETFGQMFGIDQSIPRRIFYYMKKEFFPWVYYKSMVKGTWVGPKGWST